MNLAQFRELVIWRTLMPEAKLSTDASIEAQLKVDGCYVTALQEERRNQYRAAKRQLSPFWPRFKDPEIQEA